ncbi:GIY-YIG nuclease family protein [Microvirga splendida]|uniref:GIY-YIG nuclease family protein n=1 Tax=Microvirga splendida TaxID=2795727 RepID=A0ABS0XXK9_9HYPH|nr:GIY-YIG nuclease family protein [Microvirga splendida]MBJ6124784.1 GIY-YIG nuclease family protein [Microvirga splendida]
MANAFTLRIYVPSGDPEGVRIVDRMNWTGRGYVVPRDRWIEVKNRAELANPGVYILIGYETDEIGVERPVAYIGQTDNVKTRIENHDIGKEFWEQAILFISTNYGLNRAHTTWLEWELIQRALSARRCRLENKIEPGEPNLIESEKADTRAFLNEMVRLMPVMGVQIFEAAKTAAPAELAAAGLLPAIGESKDLIVVPAQKEGFEHAFINQNAWWSIRVAEKHRANLKWIAAYQVSPIAAVTHIAEIDHLEPYGDTGKWKVVFKGPAIKLPKTIPFGDAPSGAMQGPRYTTYSALQKAQSVKDLVK